ncbi:MAG: tol-pal system protein YbgF [bacterium ADurb.Bin243]|nr:MAG: tol-pal system protein YbgF [bacterium ADurb.Bin243]
MLNLKRKSIYRLNGLLIMALFTFVSGFYSDCAASSVKADDAAVASGNIISIAKKRMDAGEQEKALELMKKYVQQYPEAEAAAELFVLIAKCEKDIYEKNRSVMAKSVIASYEQIINKYPYSELGAEACFQIGQIYEKELKDNDEALKFYEKCVVEYPVTTFAASSLYRTGQIYESREDYEGAIIAYQRLSNDFAKYQIAVDSLLRVKDIYATKMKQNNKTIDKSIEAYYEVLNNYPENKKTPEVLMELAKFYKEKKGDAENSIKTYQQVIEKFEKDPKAYDAYMEIARIHEENKDYKNLAQTYNKLYEAYPTHEKADKTLFEIAQIYEINLREYKKKRIDDKTYFRLEKNNLNEAVKYYTKIVDNFPQSKYAPAALMKIGDILNTDMANGLDARLMYKAVVEKYPDSKEYAQALETYNKMR